jgi:hypothetical protein
MPEGPPTIFVSYAREDSGFALRLGQDLRAAGAQIWLDQLDIPAGARWDEAVQEALARCPSLLVVLSPDSVASDNVMDEVSFALDEGKLVVPVICRPCEIPFRLRRVQYIDCTRDYDAALAKLTSTLAAGQAAPPRPPPKVKPEPRPAWRRYGFGFALAGILAVAVYSGATVLRRAPAVSRVVEEAPFFMVREVREADLAGQSPQQLELMRNEIYARHGRRFRRPDIQEYFNRQPWYTPKFDANSFPNDLLSRTQMRNVQFIAAYEKRLEGTPAR